MNLDFSVEVWSDTNVRMHGMNGQANIFGKQKGLTEQEIDLYDKGLQNLCEIYKRKFDVDVQKPKMGGSGGIASALHLLFDCEVLSGADQFFSSFLNKQLLQYNKIIFTEGKYDKTSAFGKVAAKVIEFGQSTQKDVIGFFALTTAKCDNFAKHVSYLPPNWSGTVAENETLLRDGLKQLKKVLIAGRKL